MPHLGNNASFFLFTIRARRLENHYRLLETAPRRRHPRWSPFKVWETPDSGSRFHGPAKYPSRRCLPMVMALQPLPIGKCKVTVHI